MVDQPIKKGSIAELECKTPGGGKKAAEIYWVNVIVGEGRSSFPSGGRWDYLVQPVAGRGEFRVAASRLFV